jgi:glycerate kinase
MKNNKKLGEFFRSFNGEEEGYPLGRVLADMKIVVAPDSFKGSLTAAEAADAIEIGFKRVFPATSVVKVPMADGGEGTVQSLVDATGGRIIYKDVTGPLGHKVRAFFGILGDGKTAVIEMAAASGLPLVPDDKRNPLITTTYGTGELIKYALEEGCKELIIGIGGSATNDGGAGMAQALGFKLLDEQGSDLGFGGGTLANLHSINGKPIDQIRRIQVACDVDNPLCGPRGASAVYGPQKGATAEMVEELDAALSHYADIIKKDLGKDVKDLPGAGAAGGLGAGLVAFLDAQLMQGVEIVIQATGLREKIRGASLVITGEGKLDSQTMNGKTPMGVLKAAKEKDIPTVAIGGTIEDSVLLYENGFDGLMSITHRPMPLKYAIENAWSLVADAAERVARLIKIDLKTSSK